MQLTISVAEQLIVIIHAFFFKPIYMTLTLILVCLLKQTGTREVVWLRRALCSFLFGELMCMTNYLVGHMNDWIEIAHQLGMIGASAMLPLGFFTLLDQRVLHLTDPARGCAAVRFCRRCWKQEGAEVCGVRRFFSYLAPALGLVAFLPITAPLRPLALSVTVFGAEVFYNIDKRLMLVQFRIYPVLAMVGLATATIILFRGGPRALESARAPFFAGLGFLFFSLLRFFLTECFRVVPIYIDFWEQLTELLMVLGMAWFLWVFRQPLGIPSITSLLRLR